MRPGKDGENWPIKSDKVMVFEYIKYKGRQFGFIIDNHSPRIVFQINCNPEWVAAYEAYKKQKQEESHDK